MRRKILAFLLSFALIITFIPTNAFAAPADELKSDIVLTEGTVGGKAGIFVDWKVTTGAGNGICTANIAFTYDTTIFDLVDSSGNALTLSTAEPPKLNDAQLVGCTDFVLFNDLYAKAGSGNYAHIAFIRSGMSGNEYTNTTIGQVFLAYKGSNTKENVSKSTLRLATTEEAGILGQSKILSFGVGSFGSTTEYYYNNSLGDTFNSANITFGEGFDFAKLAPVCNAPTGLNAIYGQKLSEITLTNPAGNTEGAWSWVNGEQLVGDVSTSPNTFKAKFTPTDAETYATVTDIDVAVTVSAKALMDVSVSAISDNVP